MSARAAPSTIAHVLRLVGSSYLDSAAGPSSRAYRHLPRVLNHQSVTATVRTSRRFASSAHALLDGRYGDSDLPIVRTPKKTRYHLPRAETPEWAAVPEGPFSALFVELPRPSVTVFKRRFQEAGVNSKLILPAARLAAVAEIWCSPDTGRGDWLWLLHLLNDIKEADPPWEELPGSESLFRVLRGVAFAVSGDWETARANVAVGVKVAVGDAPSPDFFPAPDLLVLDEYVQMCRDEGRIEDVGIVVKYAGQKLHKRLCQISGTTMGGGPDARRLRKLLHDALNDIPNPFKWLEQQQLVRGRDGGFSRANYHLAVTLLAALVADKSRVNDAFIFWRNLVQHFNSTSIPPSVASMLAANLARDRNFDAAKQVFASLHEKHATVPHSALSRELWAFSNVGETEEARRVWNLITSRYGPTRMDRLALATAYAAKGDHDEAKEALLALLGPDMLQDVDALVILQRAYIAAADAEGALGYVNLAAQEPTIKPTARLFDPLLFLYAKQANVDGAVDIFQRMIAAGIDPSKRAYTSLISAFANKADYVNAGFVFKAMQKAGYEPDAVAWSALLNATIEAGEWMLAADQCERIPSTLLRTPELETTVLKAYVLIRAPNDVIMNMFRRMRSPAPQAWALAIIAAADDGNMILARGLFDEMDSRAKLDPLCPAPNVYVYSILLAMYLNVGDRDSARAVYETMIFRNVLPTSITYGIITSGYANSPGESSADQAHKFAMSVYDQVIAAELPHARGVASENVFGPLLVAAGRAKDLDSVKHYYDFIRDSGCTSLTLTAKLMDAYRRSGKVKEVYRLWLRLFRNAVNTIPRLDPKLAADPLKPTTRSQNNILCVPLSITLKAFAEAGEHDRLKKIWLTVRTSGFGFDAQNYNHMASALAVTGDVEGAFHIVDRVILPRYDEVRERYYQALRDSDTLRPVQADSTPDDIPDSELDSVGDWNDPTLTASDAGSGDGPFDGTTDDIGEFGPRVSNRRRQYLATSAPRSREEREDDDDYYPGPDANILRYWRPSDVLWRPSAATLNILDQAYTQLEDQRAYNAWVGLSIGDETESEDDGMVEAEQETEPPVIHLPEFNNVTVKNQDGTPKRMSPKLLLLRINRKYARAVALVNFHRRKRVNKARREA